MPASITSPSSLTPPGLLATPAPARADAPRRPRSSDGSLFAQQSSPDCASCRRDWMFAMAVFGALIGLAAALRLHPGAAMAALGLEVVLCGALGALLGLVLHPLARPSAPPAPVERFARSLSGRR